MLARARPARTGSLAPRGASLWSRPASSRELAAPPGPEYASLRRNSSPGGEGRSARRGEMLRGLRPVDHVPPGVDVVGALVLVLQVVGVLPDVAADDRRLTVGDRCVLVGLEATARPDPSWISQAQPEPNWFTPAFLNSSWKEAKSPHLFLIASASSPSGSPPPSGLMISPKKEGLEWPPPLLRTTVSLSPSLSRFCSTSLTSLSAHSVPSRAAFALST